MTINSRYLDVIDDERGTLRIEFFRGLPVLHSTFRKPFSAMRAARRYLPVIRAWLKRMGHYEVFVCAKASNLGLRKFAEALGFSVYKPMNGYVLMFQRC